MMANRISGLITLALVLGAGAGISRTAKAGLLVENNLFYLSNSLKTSTSDSLNGLFTSFFAGATIPKRYFIGWNVNYVNRTVVDSLGNAKLSTVEMGPRVGMLLGKQQWWSIALAYHPLEKATFNPPSGSALQMQGSGFQFELGFSPQISKSLFAGMKIVYNMANFSEQTDDANQTTKVSFSQSTVLPVIYLSWRFGATGQ